MKLVGGARCARSSGRGGEERGARTSAVEVTGGAEPFYRVGGRWRGVDGGGESPAAIDGAAPLQDLKGEGNKKGGELMGRRCRFARAEGARWPGDEPGGGCFGRSVVVAWSHGGRRRRCRWDMGRSEPARKRISTE
jgi:hypothetical protein